MNQVDLKGRNRIVFTGDYIDYGKGSFQVLKYIYELQKQYESGKVIALKGNHEQMFLEWIHDFRNPCPPRADGLPRTGGEEIFADILFDPGRWGKKLYRYVWCGRYMVIFIAIRNV